MQLSIFQINLIIFSSCFLFVSCTTEKECTCEISKIGEINKNISKNTINELDNIFLDTQLEVEYNTLPIKGGPKGKSQTAVEALEESLEEAINYSINSSNFTGDPRIAYFYLKRIGYCGYAISLCKNDQDSLVQVLYKEFKDEVNRDLNYKSKDTDISKSNYFEVAQGVFQEIEALKAKSIQALSIIGNDIDTTHYDLVALDEELSADTKYAKGLLDLYSNKKITTAQLKERIEPIRKKVVKHKKTIARY